jgi:hypothetical protein
VILTASVVGGSLGAIGDDETVWLRGSCLKAQSAGPPMREFRTYVEESWRIVLAG